jgi:hypothetical protein
LDVPESVDRSSVTLAGGAGVVVSTITPSGDVYDVPGTFKISIWKAW